MNTYKLLNIKLEKIDSIWRNYIWEFKSIQKRIRFTNEVRTNYFSDIIAFFDDTLPLIYNYPSKSLCDNQIFNTVGFLQIIYAQQDLLDEMLYIFKLDKSSKLDKNQNRSIRNELIGHPISRYPKEEGQKFKSSVFLGNELSNTVIHYIKYTLKNPNGTEYKIQINDVIERHYKLLLKYFDIILDKLGRILKAFSLRVEELLEIESKVDFEIFLNEVEIRYEFFFNTKEIFKKENIIKAERLRTSHKRYEYAFNLFKSELNLYIKDTLKNINNLEENTLSNELSNEEIKFTLLDISSKKIKVDNNKNYWYYLLSKLASKHSFFDINYFKKEFKHNTLIFEELTNMEINFNNDFEYYISYEYVRFLIINSKIDN